MEMMGGQRIDSEHVQHSIDDGAESDSRVKEEAKASCTDAEMMPCSKTEFMDVADESVFFDVKVVDDDVLYDTELVCNVEVLSSSSELEPWLGSHVKDGTEPEIQSREAARYVALEPCTGARANKVSKENELSEEHCIKDLAKEMDPCWNNHAPERLGNGNIELFSNSNEMKEAQNNSCLQTCQKDQVKEPTNDDVYSEVSNPNPSPKQVTSSFTISSQPLDVLGGERGGCGEITSACSWNSYADGNFREEEQNKCKLDSARVVLEIPKHVRPTGIRKITFKFSKRKDDRDTGLLSAKPLADDKFHEDLYNNKISVSAADGLSIHGFRNDVWTASENSKVKSGTVDGECLEPRSPSCCAHNMELKMSKKIIPDNYPTNVKKLLSTGILEGARVKYISMSGEMELPGIIKNGGYLCGCCDCNFSKVVSAYEFELHTGSKTRHPNNHIYLENGKPIYRVIEELKNAPLSALDTVIRAVAGSSVNEEYYQIWKASLQHRHDIAYADSVHQDQYFGLSHTMTSSGKQSSEDTPYPDPNLYSRITPFNQQGYMEALVEQKRPIKKPRHNQPSSFWEHKKTAEGGNKKRDNDLHKLLFMPNGLPDGTSLAYYSKGKRILGGYKQGSGIVCGCCNYEISPSQFEAHAGWAAKRQPYRNIYASSGLTLHDIALMLANGQSLPSSGSDDMCAVCGDGGELIICNGCPRAFHTTCLGLEGPLADDWYCPHCKDRLGPGKKAAGELRPIILRLKRVVKAPEFVPGGCVICRSQDFSAAKFDDRTVIICDQCEKEYHVGCLRESEMCDLKELPEDKWFCCDDCYKIFEALRNLASGGPEIVPASASDAVYRKHATIGLNDKYMNEIQWCILSGKSRAPGHLMLLSRAAAIFRECFDPIVARSGRDLIPVMVYGRNISGQEFSGMYCVVLIVNSIVVSAALIRIFGKYVAELPLVATDRESQGKGYFQALFSCIQSFLLSMNVRHLVLPAAEEAEPMWTNKLGFRKTSHEQMLKYTRDFQLTIFKGTSLLEKEVQP